MNFQRLYMEEDLDNVKAFMLQLRDYVTVVKMVLAHYTAYAFGEDDYNTCRKYGVDFAEPVDERNALRRLHGNRFVMEERS